MNPDDFALIREALVFVNGPPTNFTARAYREALNALARIEAHRCVLPSSIVDALNSGDGVYRP